MNNFIGKSWIGVVENIDDPLKLGRVKVRIFGYHTEDLIALPTAALPWSTLMTGPNMSGSFNVPEPGSYVSGYFSDGESTQNPYIVAVLPGVRNLKDNPWNTNIGFSPQPLFPGNPAEPDAPVMPDAIADAAKSNPTTNSYISRGIVANTGISLTNSSLGHVCDFRYNLNFSVGSLGLINPITAIQNAMKSGKNKAAMLISSIISQLNDKLRLVIKSILVTLNLDPSGILSSAYSYVKNIVRQINEITLKIAKVVETVSAVYYLIQDIQQIITYLKSLPARFLAMLQDCIANFTSAIKNFTSQVLAIPGAIGNSVQSVASNLGGSADSLLSSLTASAQTQTGDLPDSLKGLFTDPNLDHTTVITEYITNTYDANTVMTQVESTNFDPNKVQWA